MKPFDPSRRQDRGIIIELYKDGRLLKSPEALSSRAGVGIEKAEQGIDAIRDTGAGTAVVDPRFVGYRYPSYTFVETKDHLGSAIDADRDSFREQPQKALMLGTVLGGNDLVHRRVDEDRWKNAQFAVRAKNQPELNFFENQETYPVFQIIRWHGKDRTKALDTEPETPDSLSLAVLRHLMRDITLSDQQISESIRTKIENDDTDLLEDDRSQITAAEVGERRQSLRNDDILLGYSIDFDLEKIGWHRAIMGISLKPGYSDEGHAEAVETLQGFDDDLSTNTEGPLNEFTMPYITSGLGQSWADLLLEVLVSDVNEINNVASRIRDEIEPVQTTRTHLMTETLFEKSIKVDNWHQLNGA